MKDKRKVSTDALDTLGTIIEDGRRDAIHLAVEPVIAGEILKPGQNIGLKDGRAYSNLTGVKPLGIADPFLSDRIQPGQKFWLVVYPRQITSLRHVWSHPDFPEAEVNAVNIHPGETSEQAKSRQWIEGFADRIDQTYRALMRAADLWYADGEYTYDNSETYKEHWADFDTFWIHYEIVRGITVPDDKKESFFTCSC